MRRVTFVLACIALALAQPSVPGASAQKQKEVRVMSHHQDGGPGEQTTLDALVGLSDAVVVGRVVGARPSNISPNGRPDKDDEFFSSAYSLRIEQVLVWARQLSDEPKPTSMEVEVMGVGDVDRGSHIQRHTSDKFRELQPGKTYLIFINKYALGRSADARVVWVPATGDGQSIIEIRAGNVAPQSSSRLALNLAALTPTALFEKIKQVPRGGRQ